MAQELIICPYDPAHKILPFRFVTHLIKCKKNFPEGYRKICPHDWKHHIKPSEFDDHLKNCPERLLSELREEKYKREAASGRVYNVPKQQPNREDTTPLEENWDSGPSWTYDPNKKGPNSKHIRPDTVNARSADNNPFEENEPDEGMNQAHQANYYPVGLSRNEPSGLIPSVARNETMPTCVGRDRGSNILGSGNSALSRSVGQDASVGHQLEQNSETGGVRETVFVMERGVLKKMDFSQAAKGPPSSPQRKTPSGFVRPGVPAEKPLNAEMSALSLSNGRCLAGRGRRIQQEP